MVLRVSKSNGEVKFVNVDSVVVKKDRTVEAKRSNSCDLIVISPDSGVEFAEIFDGGRTIELVPFKKAADETSENDVDAAVRQLARDVQKEFGR